MLKDSFIEAYQSMLVYPDREPALVKIPAESVQLIESELAPLRMKNYRSSVRGTSRADAIGLMGELASQAWAGLSPNEAWESFSQGLGGDGGIDIVLAGITFDNKTTTQSPPRWTITLTNRHREQANAYLFVHLHACSDGSVNASLAGWSWRRQVKHLIRTSEDRPQLGRLFLPTLQREKLIYPLSHLKLQQARGEN